MAFGKKNKPVVKKAAPVAPAVKKAAPVVEKKAQYSPAEERMIALLTEILNALPSKEEQIFVAAMTGLVAKAHSVGGDGEPQPGIMDLARKFADKMDMR